MGSRDSIPAGSYQAYSSYATKKGFKLHGFLYFHLIKNFIIHTLYKDKMTSLKFYPILKFKYFSVMKLIIINVFEN